MNSIAYILLSLNIALLVLGQTLWKLGLKNIKFQFSILGIARLLLNPYIFSGLIIYMIATALWLYLLSKSRLSVIYPLQSLCYVAAAIIAVLIFKENIPITRWAGIALIILGAYFVTIK